MNQLTLLDRISRKAHKAAVTEGSRLVGTPEQCVQKYREEYDKIVDHEFMMLEKALKLKDRLDDLLTQYNITQPKPDKLSENYFWITLRPSDEHRQRFTDFKHAVLTQYLTRNCFISYRYAWEQKGETPDTMGHGYHIHILAHCPNYLMKTQLIKDTKSTFKKFCNGNVPDSFVQVEYVRTKEHFNNIRAYIMGYKNDSWKDNACAMDKPWRAKLGLDDLYGSLDLDNK